MAETLTNDQLRRLRMRSQRLDQRDREEAATVAEVVAATIGVQAQELPAAGLAVRARSTGLTSADVDQARNQQRSTVRTWAMRGTFYLLAAEDATWLLELLGPIFIAKSRRRRLELGLDDDTCARGIAALRDVLAHHGPLTRAEIVDRLRPFRIVLKGQAAPHLLHYAALQRVVCCGPDRGREPSYVLFDDWVEHGPSYSREAALAELARRYITAFGPAGPEDFAAWSGLPRGDVANAWRTVAGEQLEVEHDGRPLWLSFDRADWLMEPALTEPTVRLLGAYDGYLLGYRDRALSIPAQHARRLHPGGGLIRPALLVEGQIVATWMAKRRRDRLDVTIEPFDRLPGMVEAALDVEVQDLGRFLGMRANVTVDSSSYPTGRWIRSDS